MMNQNRIKQLRLSRAWSQEQLAELTIGGRYSRK